jgi:hypothetical protein
LDLLDELLLHYSSFTLILYDEFMLGVVNALIERENENQWWSPLDDE